MSYLYEMAFCSAFAIRCQPQHLMLPRQITAYSI